MQIIKGVEQIVQDYQLFVVDLWGVMHDGVACYPEALECLTQLKKHQKRVALLSNAPRRTSDVIHRSEALGLKRDLFDLAFSSGEMTWHYLQKAPLGKRAFPIMTDKDRSLIDDTPIELEENIALAHFILCSGPDGERANLKDWEEVLQEAQMRTLPMLCANPDLIVHRGGKEEICAGTLAQHYESLGGKVIYYGKPHPEIYRHLMQRAENLAGDNAWIAFGDSFRTDIKGALGAGGKGLFVAGGIHSKELLPHFTPLKLESLVNKYGYRPDFALDYLRW